MYKSKARQQQEDGQCRADADQSAYEDVGRIVYAYPNAGQTYAHSEQHPENACFSLEQPKADTEREKQNRMVARKRIVYGFLHQLIHISKLGEWLVVRMQSPSQFSEHLCHDKRGCRTDYHHAILRVSREPVEQGAQSQRVDRIFRDGVKRRIQFWILLPQVVDRPEALHIEFHQIQE